MAVSGSGLYVITFRDALDATGLALDLEAEDHKVALFTNSITPNYTTDTAYGVTPYDANEVSGTGYTAGGAALSTTTWTGSGGVLTFDAADTSWSTATIANARAALVYADALAGNNAICLIDFGADYTSSAGTFQITYNASGIFTLDLVP